MLNGDKTHISPQKKKQQEILLKIYRLITTFCNSCLMSCNMTGSSEQPVNWTLSTDKQLTATLSKNA